MSEAQQTTKARGSRRPRATARVTPGGNLFRPAVNGKWIGNAAYPDPKEALQVARAYRDHHYPLHGAAPTPPPEVPQDAPLELAWRAIRALDCNSRDQQRCDKSLADDPNAYCWCRTLARAATKALTETIRAERRARG